MSDSDTVTINLQGLDKLQAALKKMPVVRVGILQDSPHPPGDTSVASIGFIHEFGNEHYPVRSFLRMPLTMMLGKELDKSDLMSEANIREVIRTKTFQGFMDKIGSLCVNIVLDAFDTEGFGTWAPWKNPAERKANSNRGMILQDTGQLRDHIKHDVIL